MQIRRNISKKDIDKIKDIIIGSGGIQYAEDKIKYFSKMAIDELGNFPDTDYKKALIDAVEFNVNRKY